METLNLTDDEIFEKLNSEERIKYMGGIVLVCVLMAFGLVRNIHVLIVFTCKVKSSNHKTFICCLCLIDMIACTIGMPTTILDLANPLTFPNSIFCKIMANSNYFMCISSALVLLLVTFDRYRKICHPLGWQLNHNNAKTACIITLLVSYGLSLPSVFIFGSNTVEVMTLYSNLTGVCCSTDDKYITSNFATVFNGVLIFLAIIVFPALIFIYILISRVIMRRGKKEDTQHRDNTSSPKVFTIDTTEIESASNARSNHIIQSQRDTIVLSKLQSSDVGSHETVAYTMHMKSHSVMFRETRRKTIIFFFIVAIYMCSYLPKLVVTVLLYTNYEFFQNQDFSSALAYNTLKWLFFANNVANPVVYFFLDVKFRSELKLFYCSVFN